MKKYEDLLIELILLANCDVITASAGDEDRDNPGNAPDFPENWG